MDYRDHSKRQDLYDRIASAQKAYQRTGELMDSHVDNHIDDETFYDDDQNRVGACSTCDKLEKTLKKHSDAIDEHTERLAEHKATSH